jgi:hypothetical protein
LQGPHRYILVIGARVFTPRVARVAQVVLLAFFLLTAAEELVRFAEFLHSPGYLDIGNYYLWARMGWHDGWNTLYNVAIERREWQALGGASVLPIFPMVYPPPMAWLVAPLAILPFFVAIYIWLFLCGSVFLWMWRVLVPGSRLRRWTHFAGAFGLFPVLYGVALGNAVVPVLGAVTGTFTLLARRREVWAGIILLLIDIKPQIAILVPFALLLAGYRRTFAVWAIGTAIIGLLAVASIGPTGVQTYAERLREASAAGPDFGVPTSLTVAGLLGRGWVAAAAQAGIGAATLFAAYHRRGQGPEWPIAVGLVGSLLITPYIHWEDLTATVVAAWLYWRTSPPMYGRLLIAAGYLAMAPTILLGGSMAGLEPVFVLLQIAWLLTIALIPARTATALPTQRGAEPDAHAA